ncbi:Crossover junction endonuclease MUS81 [Morella rubra]|uniref:Crossover junction endonuclease MUS81 n=1 Tax=Morella rubra TaxID=262757 RepID=A0A6A1WJD8_9ROSI|nr:Crossover junction endonuclease MUS81 [Morella rubra]KAB1227527.1 Crossover junction endonuclease MUS81 [Morella rubra]
MDKERRVVACPENEGVAAYMCSKRQELAEKPKGISENVDATLSKAYSNICNSRTRIKTLKDLSQIKGVGKWILRLMQGFFETSSGSSEPEGLTKEGKKKKGTKRYVPQKNSVAYAMLIALYRGTATGNEFMHKQELIDAAEGSGLSRVPIAPEKGKGKPGQFGSSPKDWYSGWNCMKTLITKGLVVKSSCPAKYMLTQEGQDVARDCLMRSGLTDPAESLANAEGFSDQGAHGTPDLDFACPDMDKEVTSTSMGLSRQNKSIDVPMESLDKCCPVQKSRMDGLEANMNILSMPPVSFGERFEDLYEVILILDDREQFATQGSRSRRIIENIRSQFRIKIEVRRLPVGDGIWIARHRYIDSEYRCGLKKLIYLVEGDPNSSEAAESIKTACFTTEILEGFDVQRTTGLADTLKKYGHLTQAISHYYKSVLPEDHTEGTRVCPPFDEFVKRCQDLDKMTVSDVFAIQLMQVNKHALLDLYKQVPQVTEEVAIAVLDLYPTLLSLACAYSFLEGDTNAQEEMLRRQSKDVINAVASRNIFQLVWGNQVS